MRMPHPLRLLVTGIGSLVGQNILDALEGRREHVEIVGTNAAADTPRVFRCDRAYLVPPNDDPGYKARLLEIIRDVSPDLILPARDPDVSVLAAIKESQADLAARIAVGTVATAIVVEDKAATWEFAQRHRLPFAESLATGPNLDAGTLSEFVSRHGFPFVAKPRRGSGSIGVRIVLRPDQLAHAVALPDYVLQPFLGEGAERYLRPPDDSAGVPFFYAPPDTGQFACQCVIGPTGGLSRIFCGLHVMVMGRCEQMWAVDEPGLHAVGARFATAMAEEGWRGPLNLAFRRCADGTFAGFEINGRMTGGTSGRLWLGFDEIGEVAKAWYGENPLPCLSAPVPPRGKVIKTLVDGFLPEAEARSFQNRGVFATGQIAGGPQGSET